MRKYNSSDGDERLIAYMHLGPSGYQNPSTKLTTNQIYVKSRRLDGLFLDF